MKGRYTMGSPYDNIGAYNYNMPDYNSLLMNRWFLEAAKSPNLNFKASQANNTQQQTTDDTSNATANNVVDYAAVKPDESHTGLWITGAIGAAALITCAAKGKGNIAEGAKKIYEGFFKKGKKQVEKSVGNKLQSLQVVRKGDKVECFVPGEKTTIKGNNDVINHLNAYGIDLRSITGFKDGVSKLAGGTFKTEGGYNVTFEGDKVTKIINKSGKDVTKTCAKDTLEKIKAEIETAKEMDKFWMKNFSEAKVVREIGDEVAHVTYRPKKAPEITSLNTNKPVDLTDDAVKSWIYEHPEDKALLGKKAFAKYNAPEGMKIGNAKFTADGVTYHFENGEIVGITKDKYYAKGKKECNVILADKEEDMKKVYEAIFNSDKLSDTIRRKFGGKLLKGVDMSSIQVDYVKA